MSMKREALKPTKNPKSYNEVAGLKKQELKQLCAVHGLDQNFPKKATLIFLCHLLGISTTGDHKVSKVSNRNVDSLSASQLEEFEQLNTYKSFTRIKDWTTDLTCVPDIDESIIKKYLLKTNFLSLESARTYKVTRPYQLKPNVHTVRYSINSASETFGVLSARCNPSQSTSPDEVKVVFIVIDKITGVPYGGLCTCTVGCSETCGHIGAALFRLADFVASGIKQVPEELSCTEKLCEWTDPKGSKATATILDELTIKKVKQPIRRTVNDFGKKIANPDPPSYDAILELRSALFAATFRTGQFCPAVSVLNGNRFLPPTVQLPKPQIVTKLPDSLPYDCPELVFCKELVVESTPLLITDFPHQKFKNTPQEKEMHQAVQKFVTNLKYSEADIKWIEDSTIGQSKNPVWFKQRKGAITASKFSKVRHAMEIKKQNCESLVNEILADKQPKPPTIPALKWGLTHEKSAKIEYMKKFKKWHKDLEIVDCGLKVCKDYQFVRVSPDGIVTCKCHSEVRLLEIKCPYASRNLTVREAVSEGKIKYIETDNGRLLLKQKSKEGYFEQCQGLMGVCQIRNCNFVVWTPKDCVTIHVPFDENFWKNRLLPACVAFFQQHVVPAILYPMASPVKKTLLTDPAVYQDRKRTRLQPELVVSVEKGRDTQQTNTSSSTIKQKMSSDSVQKQHSSVKPSSDPSSNVPHEYKCGKCFKLLPEDNILPDNSNASVGCDCPNCGGCDVWFCWPCAKYDDDWLQEATDWYCPDCTRTCDIVY